MKELRSPERNLSLAGFFAGYMKKNWKAYLLVLTIIEALELVMIVRGLFVFDFGKTRHVLYFVSYIALLLATAAAQMLIWRNHLDRMKPNTIAVALHIYCTVIVVWGLLVSYLDMIVGNTPIVYLTVIMSVGGISIVYPPYYAINLLVSFAVLLSFRLFADMPYFHTYSNGIYINLAVFEIVSLTLAIRQYRVSRREYEMSEHLAQLSFRDHLTGIRNRRVYDEDLHRIGAEDAGALVGILDLDGFKQLNDTYGHDFGDDCLRETAAQLSAAFGEGVYRIGGDEFAVLCAPDVIHTAQQRVDEINRRLAVAFPERSISISAGFCPRTRGSGADVEAVAERADRALYAAKADAQRSCVIVEGEDMP